MGVRGGIGNWGLSFAIFFTKHNIFRKIAHLKDDGHLQVKINDDDHLQVTIITIF